VSKSKSKAKSSRAAVLLTESLRAYKRMRGALKNEIAPQGAMERIYLADIVHLQWEIRRYRRAKVALLNAAYRNALRDVISELMCGPDEEAWELIEKAKQMAFDFFSDVEVRKCIAQRLEHYGLDATAIEAKVLQNCCSELSNFDRLLASAEARRLKAVRALAEFRSSLRRHITNASTSRRDRRR
jgi:hypothetical protein